MTRVTQLENEAARSPPLNSCEGTFAIRDKPGEEGEAAQARDEATIAPVRTGGQASPGYRKPSLEPAGITSC